MTSNESQQGNGERLSDLHESIKEKLGWIEDLVKKIYGPDATVEEKLPLAPQDRSTAPDPGWNADQEAAAREVGKRFGYGAEHDTQSGLIGGIRVAEGGKVWKMMAEAEAIKGENQPSRIIFAGSPHIKLDDEQLAFLAGHDASLSQGATEYDAASWIAANFSDGSVNDKPVPLEFGYQISKGNPIVREATGQLVRIGQTSTQQSVELLKVEREDFTEEETGKTKYQFQPSANRIISMIAEALGDEDPTPIGLVTSSTYASRQFNTIEARLKDDRPQFGDVFYGRETLRRIGAPVPAEIEPNQLAGDLRMAYEKLSRIKGMLEQQAA